MCARGNTVGISNRFIVAFLRKAKANFMGVFPINKCPIIALKKKRKATLIINTSPSYLEFGHFVTVLKIRDKIMYIDPLCLNQYVPLLQTLFALPVFYLVNPIQSINSDYCGFYSILFVLHQTYTPTLHLDFIVSNQQVELRTNDKLCIKYIKQIIKCM